MKSFTKLNEDCDANKDHYVEQILCSMNSFRASLTQLQLEDRDIARDIFLDNDNFDSC